MKRLFQITLLLLGVAAADHCRASEQEVYRDKYVTAFVTDRSPLLAPHGERSTSLKTFGKTYKDVRGAKPYYVEVPDINSIVFVTEDGEDDVRMHIINLNTTNQIVVKLDSSGFGINIGYEQFGRKRGQALTDYVETKPPRTLLLHNKSSRWEEITTVNIASRSVERRETIYRDEAGNVTKRFVDGKRVE